MSENNNDTDDPFAVPHRPERQRVRTTDNMTENTYPDESALLTFKLLRRSVAWTTNIRSPWGEVLAVISAVLATPLIAVVCVCEGVFICGKFLQEAFGK